MFRTWQLPPLVATASHPVVYSVSQPHGEVNKLRLVYEPMVLTSVGPRDARQHEESPSSPVVPSGAAASTGSAPVSALAS